VTTERMSADQVAEFDRWLGGADLVAETRAAQRAARLARARRHGVVVSVKGR
jgi:hypothetical protein